MGEAAAFTLEVESYLMVHVPLSQQQVSAISEVDNVSTTSVAAIHAQQGEKIVKMLNDFNIRLQKLKRHPATPTE